MPTLIHISRSARERMAVKSQRYQEWQASLERSLEEGWLFRESTFIVVPRFLAYGVIFLQLEGSPLFEWMYEQILTSTGFQEHCPEKRRIKSIIRLHITVNKKTEYYNQNGKRRTVEQPYPFGEKMLSASTRSKTK